MDVDLANRSVHDDHRGYRAGIQGSLAGRLGAAPRPNGGKGTQIRWLAALCVRAPTSLRSLATAMAANASGQVHRMVTAGMGYLVSITTNPTNSTNSTVIRGEASTV